MKLGTQVLMAIAMTIGLGASAQASVPDAPELGPIGGAAGQVLRVTVTALDPERPVLVTVVFQDLLGRRVGPPPQLIVVRTGESKAVDLDFGIFRKGHGYVRPVLKYSEGSAPARFAAQLYDRYLGRTTTGHFADNRFGLRGSVHFAPIGLTYGETMRLAVGAIIDPNDVIDPNGIVDPNDRCVASIGFLNAAGAAVDDAVRADLDPGRWTFVDLDATTLLQFGEHQDFIPAVQAETTSAACVANVQVFDQSSGWTTILVLGGGR
jgi:hypothetical protein